MSRNTRSLFFSLILAALLAPPPTRTFAAEAQKAAVPTPADAAFAWLKGLIGTWQGKAEWTGARTGSYELTATYSLTGNGSAIVENLSTGPVPSMTSVYHEDGVDLRMTHFCGAGNQPRLKASEIDEARRIVHFKMVDVTGRVDHGHVDEVELRLPDADHLTILFTFRGPGAESLERIDLKKSGTS